MQKRFDYYLEVSDLEKEHFIVREKIVVFIVFNFIGFDHKTNLENNSYKSEVCECSV